MHFLSIRSSLASPYSLPYVRKLILYLHLKQTLFVYRNTGPYHDNSLISPGGYHSSNLRFDISGPDHCKSQFFSNLYALKLFYCIFSNEINDPGISKKLINKRKTVNRLYHVFLKNSDLFKELEMDTFQCILYPNSDNSNVYFAG